MADSGSHWGIDMKILFSASTVGFYDDDRKEAYERAGNWPDDLIEITHVLHLQFCGAAPSGKKLGSVNGMPGWVDVPPLTAVELLAAVVIKKQSLISEANVVIAPLKDASDGGYIDAADAPRLDAWQRYRYALTKVDAANPVWPDKPTQ